MGGLSFDAVIFDADGTLFDTENLMYEVWCEVGKDMGLTIHWNIIQPQKEGIITKQHYITAKRRHR